MVNPTYFKPGVVSPPSPYLSPGGTYDVSTGTYTSPSGQKSSMAKPPAGTSTYYSGGGYGSGVVTTPTRYQVVSPVLTPLEALRQEELTGKKYVPKFDNTPLGVQQKLNWYAEKTKIVRDINLNPVSSAQVFGTRYESDKQKLEKKIEEYNARGEVLTNEGKRLEEDFGKVNVYSQQEVEAYNKRVNEYQARVNAYSSQTPGLQAQVESLNRQGKMVNIYSQITQPPSTIKYQAPSSQPISLTRMDTKSRGVIDVKPELLDIPRGVSESVKSGVTDVVETVKETLITRPYTFGVEAKKEAIQLSKGTRGEETAAKLLFPSVLGKKLVVSTGETIVFAVTNPEKVFTGTLKSALTKPIGFATGTAINLLAFKGIGTIAGKAYQEISVVGKSKGYVPSTKIVIKDVATGKTRFPTAKSAEEALKKFNEEGYNIVGGKKVVFSATNYPFTPIIGRKIVVTAGRGLSKSADVPGIYGSLRGVSTYFLRLKQDIAGYKLFPSSVKELLPSSPKILTISKTPKRIPSAFRTSLSKAQSFFGKEGKTLTVPKGKPGTPYVSPALEFGLKGEAEAVVQVGTVFKRTGLVSIWDKVTGFSKYTRIDGTVVPLYELKLIKEPVNVISKSGGLVEKVSASEYVSYKPPLVSSSSIAAGLRVSKPSSIKEEKVKPSVAVSKSYKVKSVPSISRTSFSGVSKASYREYESPIIPVEEPEIIYREPEPLISYPSVPSEIPSYVPSTSPSYTPPRRVSLKVPSYIYPSYPSRPTPSIKIPPYVPLTYEPRLYPLKKVSYKAPKISIGYSVFSRLKGKQVKVASNLPKNLALRVGKSFTGKTIARSFVIKPEGVTTLLDIPTPNLKQYRTPKVGGKVFKEGFKLVEKSKYAIDTALEKATLKAARKKTKALRLRISL